MTSRCHHLGDFSQGKELLVLLLNSALLCDIECCVQSLSCIRENQFKLAEVQRKVMQRTGETENLL